MIDQRETENCLVCLKPATIHGGGYVLKQDGEEVLAGWCREHGLNNVPDVSFLNRPGCHGGYHNEYGCKRLKLENIYK